MDAIEAMNQTSELVTGLIAGLSADQRDVSTPCDQWTVHELVNHMCGGSHMIAGAMEGQSSEGGPSDMPDFLADGPVAGWQAAAAHLAQAATPQALEATHQMPFGETPGAMAVGVITADHLVHAWDLAQASGQTLNMSDELAEFALQTWQAVVPAEGRTGDGFKAAVAVDDGASALDRAIAYTGRTP